MITWCSDDVSSEEFIENYRQAYADPDFAHCPRELVDMRRADSMDISGEALGVINRLTRDRLERRPEPLQTAVLAPNDLAFGIARMYGAYASEGAEQVGVFRKFDEAMAWLGLADLTVAELDALESSGGG